MFSSTLQRFAATGRGNIRVPQATATFLQTRFFAVSVVVPSLGDSISEGTIVEIAKKEGDVCYVDDILVVIETDKVSVDVRASVEGVVNAVHVTVEEAVSVGALLCQIDDEANVQKISGSPAAESLIAGKVPPSKETSSHEVHVVPPPSALSPSSGNNILGNSCRRETRVKISRMRLRIAERLKQAQNTAAMLTTFNEIDMSNAIALRLEYKDEFEKKHGVKLGFMSFFVKASAEALIETPAVNAVIDDELSEIVYRDFVDVSIAVASPRGLVVPVLRNAENMTFCDVERTVSSYGQKAAEDKLSLEEMSGGTFTISNGGVFGSMMGTPIINPPQSAILGMHGIKKRAMVVGNEIVARPMMYVALTYDHRLVDGREAVTFLKAVCDKVENPSRILFDL